MSNLISFSLPRILHELFLKAHNIPLESERILGIKFWIFLFLSVAVWKLRENKVISQGPSSKLSEP